MSGVAAREQGPILAEVLLSSLHTEKRALP